MSMFTNTASKVLNFAGIISVALGALSAWIALGPAKLTAKNTPFWPFVASALITLVVVFALAKARKPRQPRSTTPPTFSWGVEIVITLVLASALSALSTLLAVGTLKITLTAFWWSAVWGVLAGIPAAVGLIVVDRAVARAKIN